MELDFVNLLKEIINSNKELVKDYKLVGIFGSALEKDDPEDFDFLTIGNDQKHKNFLLILKHSIEKRGFEVIFFETIKKKPSKRGDNQILIHELHYSNINDFLEREWKSLVDYIKKKCLVLYGSKNEIPSLKIRERDIYLPLYEWIKNVKSKKEYSVFDYYLTKTIPFLYGFYPKLNLNNIFDRIVNILREESDWKSQKRKIEHIFLNNL